MNHSTARNIAGVLSILFLASCDSYDSSYIPYGLKGMDAYVYNNDTDKELYAGRVEGSYFSKDETLSKGCGSFSTTEGCQKSTSYSL